MDRVSRSEAEEWKELAQKLMTHPHPEGPTSIDLFLGRMPDEWGAVPMPPGARLSGGALHSRRRQPMQIEAIFESDGDAKSVLSRYEGALTGVGWAVFEFGGMRGGFVPGGMTGVGQTYRQGDKGPILMVAALDGGADATDVRLRLDWDMSRHLPDMHMHDRAEGAERLPALSPPLGVPLRGGGGGGSSGSWYSEAARRHRRRRRRMELLAPTGRWRLGRNPAGAGSLQGRRAVSLRAHRIRRRKQRRLVLVWDDRLPQLVLRGTQLDQVLEDPIDVVDE